MRRGGRCLVLFLCVCAAPARAADDFQEWSYLTLRAPVPEPWTLATQGNVRFTEDAGRAAFYYVSQKLGYKIHPDLSFGANYTYIQTEGRNAKREREFTYQHRAELEVSPRWRLSEAATLKNRSRLEYRWIEDKGSDNTRLRQLWELEFPLKDRGPVRSFYISDEIFYDTAAKDITENRAVPAGIDLALGPDASLRIFYLIQSKKSGDWQANHVLGTSLTLSF